MSYLMLTKKLAATVAGRRCEASMSEESLADDGSVVAVLLAKSAIGDVWLVRDEDALAENPAILRAGLPVFFFDEVETLRNRTLAELKVIAATKAAFPTSRVRQ